MSARRVALIAVVLASCSVYASAAAVLVQQSSGAFATATYTSGSGSHTLTTANGNFASNTTSGSLLLMVVWFRENGGCHGVNFANVSASTSGFTWTGGVTYLAFQDNATCTKLGETFFFYITGASVMNSSTTTTVSAVITTPDNATYQLEYSLYEYSGVAAYNNDGYGVANDTGTASNPTCSTGFGSNTYLFVCAVTGYPGSNLTAAGSYTLGVNATTATIGQMDYNLAATGNQFTQYTGTLGLYATHGITFTLSSSSGGVKRHSGSIF